MRLGLIFSHRLSHMIPLYVMWLVCLNLVSEALIAQDYQHNQAQESSSELQASTASGSGASPPAPPQSAPIAPPSPAATARALPPEAANPSNPSNNALATGQPAPTPTPALFSTPEPVPAQPTLAPTPTAAITMPQPATPGVATATPQAIPVGAPNLPPTPTPTAVPIPPGLGPPVGINLRTSVPQPGIGQLFEVEVTVEAEAASPVDTVQVYLDFDPSILRVVEINFGATLEVVLQSGFDNLGGQVDYAAGTLGDSVLAPFTLVSLKFLAINPTGPSGTMLQFAPLIAPRETKAIEAGNNNLGILSPLILVIQ